MKLPSIIAKELGRAGDRWHIEQGARHKHIVIDGHLVAILPNAGSSDSAARATLNLRAQIRRHLNQFPASRRNPAPQRNCGSHKGASTHPSVPKQPPGWCPQRPTPAGHLMQMCETGDGHGPEQRRL